MAARCASKGWGAIADCQSRWEWEKGVARAPLASAAGCHPLGCHAIRLPLRIIQPADYFLQYFGANVLNGLFDDGTGGGAVAATAVEFS